MNSAGGGFPKNSAWNGVGFYLENKTTGAPITAGAVTVNYVLDDGAQGTVAATPAHKGGGQWTVDISAAENNGDIVNLFFTHPDAKLSHACIATTSGNVDSIAGSQSAATNLAAGANELYPFTVGASPSATSIPTGITGAPYTTTNHFEGRVVTINQETRKIFGSGGSPVVLTTETFNSVPSQNDPGVIS